MKKPKEQINGIDIIPLSQVVHKLDDKCLRTLSDGRNVSKNAKYWQCIVYSEHLFEFQELARTRNVNYVISPEHNKDIIDDVSSEHYGENKKPHYHVTFVNYTSVPADRFIECVYYSSNPLFLVEPVNDIRSNIRYMAHKDNPEKAQYNPADIMTIPLGFEFDAQDFFQVERHVSSVKGIIDFIKEKKIVSFKQLIDIMIEDNMVTHLSLVMKNVYFFRAYLGGK